MTHSSSQSTRKPSPIWVLWLVALVALVLDLYWTQLIGSKSNSASLGSPILAFILCMAALRKDARAMIPLFAVILLGQPLKNIIHGQEATLSTWLIWSLPAYSLFWFGGRAVRWLVAKSKGLPLPRLLPTLLTGLGAAILFYLLSNTLAWAGNPRYAQNFVGWWQAQTIGLPQYRIPSWHFLRASLAAQLLFVPSWFAVAHWARLAQGNEEGVRKKDSALAVA